MIYYRSGYAIWKYNLSQAKEGNKILQEQMNPVIDDFKRAIDLHPDPTYVLKNMLVLQRSLKRWDDAYSYGIQVKEFIKKNPDKADYLLPGLSDLSKDFVDIGVGFYKLKQYDKGIIMTNKAIELFPDNSVAYTNLGIIYKAKGNMEEARKMWEKAIQIDPKDLDPYKHLLVSYMDVKDYKNALKWALLFNQNGGKLEQSLLDFLKKY
jgi:tetratricopeptide (TPR) repeat protein